MSEPFRVGLTRDFLKADGSLGFGDIRLDLLDRTPGVAWDFLAESARELRADQLRDYDALALLGAQISSASLAGNERLAIIARFGVGYDNVDLDACTEHGVAVTITPDAVRRPMATTILTFILALAHRLLEKDRLARAGGWARKIDYMGTGLTGKVVGTIGFGNIAREFVRIAAPLDMRHIAFDPYLTAEQAKEAGAELVDLETLLRTADFVVVICALTPETFHLINAERLALMKPSAYLVSAARGPIVDQPALYQALSSGRIKGAALDVFEQEPVDPNEPILGLENVIVSPHATCWTDEWARLSGESAFGNILAVAAGKAPTYVVNRAVLETASLSEKLRRYAARVGVQ